MFLTFNGNCREAMLFYKDCFGGELELQPLENSPLAKGLPEVMQQAILRATLKREGLYIQASDLVGDNGIQKGNNVSLLLSCSTDPELRRYCTKLLKGGKMTQPLRKNDWGQLRGDLVDQFGIQWLLINSNSYNMEKSTAITTVDAYIQQFQEPVRAKLEEMRKLIRTAAPAAIEAIGYGMPGYKYLGRPLVYFAGYAGHIGFYATPTGHEAFKKELANYKTGKGSVQFPIDTKLPVALIRRIVAFRLKENETMNAAKKTVKKTAVRRTPVKKAATKKK